jgi:hypothetical protein
MPGVGHSHEQRACELELKAEPELELESALPLAVELGVPVLLPVVGALASVRAPPLVVAVAAAPSLRRVASTQARRTRAAGRGFILPANSRWRGDRQMRAAKAGVGAHSSTEQGAVAGSTAVTLGLAVCSLCP